MPTNLFELRRHSRYIGSSYGDSTVLNTVLYCALSQLPKFKHCAKYRPREKVKFRNFKNSYQINHIQTIDLSVNGSGKAHLR